MAETIASDQSACTPPGTHIHDLPDDILVLVLTSLANSFHGQLPILRQPYDPLRAAHPLQCALVCKRWLSLADSSVRTLQFRNLDQSKASQFTRRFPRLATLAISSPIACTGSLLALADSTPDLEGLKIRLHFHSFTFPRPPPWAIDSPPLPIPASVRTFTEAFARWPSLTSLKLTQALYEISAEDTEALFDALPRLPALRHLGIHFQRTYPSHAADNRRMFEWAEALTGLHTLRLTCSEILPPLSSGLFPRILRKLNLNLFVGSAPLPAYLGCFTNLLSLSIQFWDAAGTVALPESLGHLSSLTKLQIRCPQVTWPETTSSLQALRVLKIKGALPEALGHLTRLEHLSVRGNNDRQPEDLETLTSLRNLVSLKLMSCAGVSELPESIGLLRCIQSLRLSGLPSLTAVPPSLGMLTTLTELQFKDCNSLAFLPHSLGGLSSLEILQVSSCERLIELPEGLADLRALRELRIRNCGALVSVAESLWGLTRLQVVSVEACKFLTALPEMSALQKLRLIECGALAALPQGLAALPGLRYLSVAGCGRVRHLGGGINVLGTLRELHVRRTSILRGLGAGSRLQVLHVSRLKDASVLAGVLGGLTDLDTLEIKDCKVLESLPANLGSLPRLRVLRVSHCPRLRELPESIRELTLLRLLEVVRCKELKALPESLAGRSDVTVKYCYS